LTLNRYEFVIHYFLTNDTTFLHFGSSDDESNTLTTSSTFGFTKAFAAGGQLMVEFANSFVFEFAGPDHTVASSNIMINFLQPLLRGGGRVVRLENLTEAERTLLYAVRVFAHFRKQFSFNIITQAYLQLLLQSQSIRNQEANLASLQQSLRMHESLLQTGSISAINVDQVFQQYQQARVSLLQAKTALDASLDTYKISLGLPPTLPVRLDESILDQFRLSDPALDQVQNGIESLLAEYREMERPPFPAQMLSGVTRLHQFHERVLQLQKKVAAELGRWQAQRPDPREDPTQAARNRETQRALTEQLPQLGADLNAMTKIIGELPAALKRLGAKDGWELLQKRIRDESTMAYQLSIIETQIRVFLIQLRPDRHREGEAIGYARENRLDLMNERGRVVDAWRQIAVTANALEGVANVNFAADIATRPGGSNPVDFRASASSYSVGVHLEAPLNREEERNNYRLSMISYEQERYAFMALNDNIEQTIRQDLRQLETQRLSFEISRQSLLGAARAVDAARDRVLSVESQGTTATLDVLNSLNNLLQAEQGLITNWVGYETTRFQLLLDMDELQVDPRGLYIDEPANESESRERGDQLPAPRTLPGPGR
jgi:outer membrane protein TolC